VKLWDFKTAEVKHTLTNHTDDVTSLTGAAHILISGSKDHTVCMVDSQTGELVSRLEGHTGPVTCVVMDGHLIASSSE